MRPMNDAMRTGDKPNLLSFCHAPAKEPSA